MGLYGDISPGSHLERLALLGLESMQFENIAQTGFLGQASAGAEGDALQKSYKTYLQQASPSIKEETEKRDERARKILLEETEKGAFYIRPMMTDDRGEVTLKTEAQKEARKRGMRKKRKGT